MLLAPGRRRRGLANGNDGALARIGVSLAGPKSDFLLYKADKLLHLPVHFFHALAHLQNDRDSGNVHSQIAGQVQDELQPLQVVFGIEARVAFGSGRFEQTLALVETQRLRVNAVHLRHRRDHESAFGFTLGHTLSPHRCHDRTRATTQFSRGAYGSFLPRELTLRSPAGSSRSHAALRAPGTRTRCRRGPLPSRSLGPTGRAGHCSRLQFRYGPRPPAARSRNCRRLLRCSLEPWPISQSRRGGSVRCSSRSIPPRRRGQAQQDKTPWPRDRSGMLGAHRRPQERAAAVSAARSRGSYLAPQFLPGIARVELLHLLPQFADLEIASFRHLDFDFDDLVAPSSFFRRRRNALLAKAQLLTALRAWRNPQLRPAVDGWDLDLGAQRGFPRGHRDSHVDIVAVAMKHRMVSGANDDIEIARRTAVRPGIALAREANALAVAGSRFHPDLERLCALYQALAMTGRANALRFTSAAAARARGVEFHPAAGLRDHAFASAIAAGVKARDVDLHDGAAYRIPERYIDLILEVSAVLRLAAHRGARAAPEYAREDVSKPSALPAGAATSVGKIKAPEVEGHFLALPATAGEGTGAESAGAKAAAPSIGFGGSGIDVVGVEADLVVDLAFLRIAQDVVGFGEIFEFLFGFFVPGIHVWMVLARQLTKGFADFFLGGVFLHPENPVIVFLLCGCHSKLR